MTATCRTILPTALAGWDMLALIASGVLVASLGSCEFVALTVPDLALPRECDVVASAALATVAAPPLFGFRRSIRLQAASVRRLFGYAALLLLVALVGATLPNRTIGLPLALGCLFTAIVAALLVAGRVLAEAARRGAVRWGGPEQIAVIGGGPAADWIRRAVRGAASDGLELLLPGGGASVDDAIAGLLEAGPAQRVDRIVLAQAALSPTELQHATHQLKRLRAEIVSIYPDETAAGESEIAGLRVFVLAHGPQGGVGGLLKGAVDRALALLLLLWCAPLLALIAVLIRLDSPGPILFRQRRDGAGGAAFTIFKFRTMRWTGAENGNGAVQTRRCDARVTRLGAFLRQSSLDEVPQLLNVLNGTMSLVGPRPHPIAMRTDDQLCEQITPDYVYRHRVKPGITGWAQVNGLRGATDTAASLRARVEYDNYYIDNWSFWFDLRILVQTPVSLLFNRDNAF